MLQRGVGRYWKNIKKALPKSWLSQIHVKHLPNSGQALAAHCLPVPNVPIPALMTVLSRLLLDRAGLGAL
jgi:hypothetical protein